MSDMLKFFYWHWLLILLWLVSVSVFAVNGEPASLAVNDRHASKQQRRNPEKELERLKQSMSRGENIPEARLLSLVSQVLNNDPENLQALNILGNFYLQKGQGQLAKIIYARALAAHPKNSSLYNNMGVIAIEKKDKSEAISQFRKSLQYREDNYLAAANLGVLHLDTYDYRSGLKYLRLAQYKMRYQSPDDHPNLSQVNSNYAIALVWDGGSFARANDVFRQAIQHAPRNVHLLINYSAFLAHYRKDYKQARQVIERADLLDHMGRHRRRIKTIEKSFSTESQKKEGW